MYAFTCLGVCTNMHTQHKYTQSEDDQAGVIQLFISEGGDQMVKEKKKDGSMLIHLACTAGLVPFVTEILKVDSSLASVVDGRYCREYT